MHSGDLKAQVMSWLYDFEQTGTSAMADARLLAPELKRSVEELDGWIRFCAKDGLVRLLEPVPDPSIDVCSVRRLTPTGRRWVEALRRSQTG
jgi:hypothetical protein